jgi:hypothetical protein
VAVTVAALETEEDPLAVLPVQEAQVE